MTARVADKVMVGQHSRGRERVLSQHHPWNLAQWIIAEPVRPLFFFFSSQRSSQRTRAHLAYKNKGGLKQDDLRRRREEQQVEIRRQKREENIAKRRNFLPTSTADSDEETTARDWEPPVRWLTLGVAPCTNIFPACRRNDHGRLLRRSGSSARRDYKVP